MSISQLLYFLNCKRTYNLTYKRINIIKSFSKGDKKLVKLLHPGEYLTRANKVSSQLLTALSAGHYHNLQESMLQLADGRGHPLTAGVLQQLQFFGFGGTGEEQTDSPRKTDVRRE